MPATVDALLPLSLLEAVRDVDTPLEDFEAELVDDLRNKRLGLSDTVYMQIKRYTDAVRSGQRAAIADTTALAKLIGRRGDAEAVFRAAGKFFALKAYHDIPVIQRRMMLVLPAFLARELAYSQARRVTHRYFNGRVTRQASVIQLEVVESVTRDAAPRSAGCAYYEACLKELFRLLVHGVTNVEHVRCFERGEGSCVWKADWRAVSTA